MMAMMSACAPQGYAHARRVARLATAIARTVELPEPLVEQVEHCALLHDIGKLAIPDPEIEADGAQGELQSTLRRQHVRIGFDILSVVPQPGPAAALLIAVYERCDGAAIRPACAAGRFRSARASWRWPTPTTSSPPWPYRAGLSRDEANAEIVRCAGTISTPTSCAPGCAPGSTRMLMIVGLVVVFGAVDRRIHEAGGELRVLSSRRSSSSSAARRSAA